MIFLYRPDSMKKFIPNLQTADANSSEKALKGKKHHRSGLQQSQSVHYNSRMCPEGWGGCVNCPWPSVHLLEARGAEPWTGLRLAAGHIWPVGQGLEMQFKRCKFKRSNLKNASAAASQ